MPDGWFFVVVFQLEVHGGRERKEGGNPFGDIVMLNQDERTEHYPWCDVVE